MPTPAHFALAGLALALPGIAAASYGQMKLDGVASALALLLLFAWALVVGTFGILRVYRSRAWLAVALVGSALFLVLAIAGFIADGDATLRTVPWSAWAFFAVRVLLAAPLLLVLPVLQYRQGRAGGATRGPGLVLLLAFALAPVEAWLWSGLQDLMGSHLVRRAGDVAPGGVQAHLEEARDFTRRVPLKPWVWTERETAKWSAIGLSGLAFIRVAEPLSPRDREGVAEVLRLAGHAPVTWRLDAKLAWDRFLQAPGGQRPAVVAGFSPSQASWVVESYLVPHADRLCSSMDASTEAALLRLARRVPPATRDPLGAALRAKCGVTLTMPPY